MPLRIILLLALGLLVATACTNTSDLEQEIADLRAEVEDLKGPNGATPIVTAVFTGGGGCQDSSRWTLSWIVVGVEDSACWNPDSDCFTIGDPQIGEALPEECRGADPDG